MLVSLFSLSFWVTEYPLVVFFFLFVLPCFFRVLSLLFSFSFVSSVVSLGYPSHLLNRAYGPFFVSSFNFFVLDLVGVCRLSGADVVVPRPRHRLGFLARRATYGPKDFSTFRFSKDLSKYLSKSIVKSFLEMSF